MHLMSCMTRHDHRHQHKPDSRYSSTGIYPVDTRYSNSTTGTCIIVMITLTSGKFALVKAGFPIRDHVQQGHRQSTPRQIAYPGGHRTPRMAILSRAAPCSATEWDCACQEALYPRLSASVRRMVQVAGYPVHIGPHIVRLSNQVKQSKVVVAPKAIPGTCHVNAWETRRQSGSPLRALQPIFLA
jgi:hypothetical protein